MNTPNPLVPQGTFPDPRGKSHIRITVFTILAIHVAFLGLLLLQACNRKTESNFPEPTNAVQGWVEPTNLPVVAPNNPPAPTNIAVTPPGAVVPPPPLAETQAAIALDHVVVKGDTFSSLAKKYNVTSKAIAESNPGVDSSRLKIGQKLKIPSPTTRSPGNGTVVAEGAGKTYTVKSGDTLGKIAKANGVTVKALRSANLLKTDQIKVGQKLSIPSKAAAAAPETAGPPPGSGSAAIPLSPPPPASQ
jgi:LysM repeat protein